ncbi:hypothetical protein PAJ34TS1_50100 [Paenibacillus azoreducens]|uniref:Uncharacterized protein n=2 Tax=Paenibacillus azoreducens TaxID=116718 RepID=A0A920CQU0_9BACL|nr:hypothetical protein J34TS1_05280 [Paenibacillus azoreducens]
MYKISGGYMKKIILSFYCIIFIFSFIELGHGGSKAVAAMSYNGHWRSYHHVGKYDLDEINLYMKSSGNKVLVEITSDYFLPESRDGIGQMQGSSIEEEVFFNSRGLAVFKYKDEHNNGQMTIQVQNDGAKITWNGEEKSEHSFPKGTFKLYKEIAPGSNEMKKIGTFLSNFTELHFKRLNSGNLNYSDLIYFGVLHNFENNYASTVSNSGGGKLFISKSSVEQSIYKYFNIKFKNHKTVQGFKFNGKGYVFEGASGAPIDYVKALNVYDMGSNKLVIYGELYNPDNPAAGTYGSVDAVIKKVTEGNKTRYVLDALSVKN